MSRIAIYARKSSENDDRQVQSLPAQIDWARERCASLGEPNPVVYHEARSAKTPGRSEFARLVDAINQGDVSTVVCYRADRLARNALDGGAIMYAMERGLLQKIVTNDRTYVAGNPEDEFILSLDFGLSSKYSKDLSRVVKRGLTQKLEKGEITGLAPFGYRNVRSERERRELGAVAVDEPNGTFVQKLFRLAATGKYSLSDLTNVVIHEWKLTLPRANGAPAPRSFPASTIHRILRNTFYYGVFTVKGVAYAGTHQALISKALFDRVQTILSGRRTSAERPSKHSFPFVGLVTCSMCGRKLTAYARTKPSGRLYTYYVCSGRAKKICTQQPISEQLILEKVLPELESVTLTPAERDLCISILHDMNAANSEQSDIGLKRVHGALEGLNRQKSHLLDVFLAGDLSKEDYEFKKADYAQKEAELHTQLAAMTGSQTSWIELAEEFFKSLTDAKPVFEASAADEKRKLLKDLEIELEATPGELHLKAGKPTTIIQNRGGHPVGRGLVEDVRTVFMERASGGHRFTETGRELDSSEALLRQYENVR